MTTQIIEMLDRLAEYDAQVTLLTLNKQKLIDEVQVPAEVKAIYDAIQKQKDDIAAEFAGKLEAAQENIAKLTDDIKAEVLKGGSTVKSTYYQAVYVKGRVSWNTDMLDGLITVIPQLERARKVGAPSVTLRKV
jgi:hypothetical protein